MSHFQVVPTKYGTSDAKKVFLTELQKGSSIKEALEVCGRSRSAYEAWRIRDEDFCARADLALGKAGRPRRVAKDQADPKDITFEEFSERYLGQRVFPHMLNVVDLIEGREPRWKHPSMIHNPGDRDLLVVNMPPEHAKTTTVTVNYAVYRICMDPNVRIIIVSKTQTMAKKMLLAIKNRLTHPKYDSLIKTFSPIGGFDAESDSWTAEMIYVAGRDPEQKDPTVQALGVRGHIYGSRADLIIGDDMVDLTNAHEHEKQVDWIESEVMSRVSNNGALLIVGTRLAPMDLYSVLLNEDRYEDEENPWTYLAMPAVLEYADDPKDWVTLWPYSDSAERGSRADEQRPDGLWPKWDGPRMAKKRRRVKPTTWARVFQQAQIDEDTVFKPEDIKGCTNGQRNVGLIQAGMPNNRPEGMGGLIVLAGLDPATTGHTAATVLGLDPRTQKRYLLDQQNKAGLGSDPDKLRQLIYDLTDKYNVVEWVIETNGFQGFLAHDREVRSYIANRGAVIRPHYTSGGAKHDPDFGVAAMSGLFHGWQEGHNLIELPSAHMSEGVKALVEQLVSWAPKVAKHQKTDCVMSLWFAELACQRRIESMSSIGGHHVRNKFLSARDRRRQVVVNLTEAHDMWKAMV